MLTSAIIEKFRLQVDDATELSSEEELDLANDVYTDVQNDREWEWLKAVASDTTSTSVPYIALPTNFKKIAPNKDNKSVIFVGTDYQEYIVVPFSERRDYRDMDGFCYIDIPNRRLVFTLQPTDAEVVEYDYIKVADDLITTEEPIFRDGFHKIIFYGMAMKFPSIEQTDKASSYSKENETEYYRILQAMRLEDAEIKLSI